MREAFIAAIKSNQQAFQLELPDQTLRILGDYYDLVQEHNPILHLVGTCSPEEFATRHILESLTLLEFLPTGARFADVGPGAGLPSIPCLIARDDLKAVLIESKEKKVTFLRSAVAKLGLSSRTKVINKQFSEVTRPHVEYVTCRALDKFEERLARLIKWSDGRTMLLFGGENIARALQDHKITFTRNILPLADSRSLFVTIP